MITGRSNYSIYGAHLDLPLIAQPELAADPKHAVAIAIAFWNAHGLSTFADEDDIRSVTRRINGGLNGLLTRQLYLARIKRMLLPPVEPAAMV
jgi:putative chitinase